MFKSPYGVEQQRKRLEHIQCTLFFNLSVRKKSHSTHQKMFANEQTAKPVPVGLFARALEGSELRFLSPKQIVYRIIHPTLKTQNTPKATRRLAKHQLLANNNCLMTNL